MTVDVIEAQKTSDRSLKERVLALLDEKGWSQQDLNEEVSVSYAQMNQVLNGESSLKPKLALEIFDALLEEREIEAWDWIVDDLADKFIEARKEIENERTDD